MSLIVPEGGEAPWRHTDEVRTRKPSRLRTLRVPPLSNRTLAVLEQQNALARSHARSRSCVGSKHLSHGLSQQGPDDMPAHVKAAMFGSSLTLPIRAGRLALGTWQGIWLCEHRDEGTPRSLIITIQGMSSA